MYSPAVLGRSDNTSACSRTGPSIAAIDSTLPMLSSTARFQAESEAGLPLRTVRTLNFRQTTGEVSARVRQDIIVLQGCVNAGQSKSPETVQGPSH